MARVALIGPDVRAALFDLAALSVRVHVRRGVVEVVWSGIDRGHGAEMMPDAALAIALGIRAAIERA